MPLNNMKAKQQQRVEPLMSSNSNHSRTGFIKKTMQMGVLAGVLSVVPTMFPMTASAETFQVVYHVVEKGETLSGLSEKFSVSMNDLRKLNDISSNNIQAGQRLLIPINKIVLDSLNQSKKLAVTSQQQPPAKISNNTGIGKGKYQVVSGDTLGAIAIRHKVSLANLLKANHISADYLLKPNQVLIIPTVGVNSTNTSRQPAESSIKPRTNVQNASTYTVKSGDMLISIANAHKVDVADIMEFNGITNDFLRVGQVLKIPKLNSGLNNPTTTTRNRTPQATQPMTYTVQSGDVLGAIADKHGVDLSQLIKINSLEGKQDTLQVGQVLQLPSNAKGSAKAERVESKPRIRDTVNKAVGSSGY